MPRVERRARLVRAGLLGLVVLIAIGVRFVEMRDATLWLDEAMELRVADRPAADVLIAVQLGTHDPPLFGLLLHLWLGGGRTDFYLKVLPALLSVAAVPLVYALGRMTFAPSVGLLSALVVALAPRAVYYGQEVNQYALVLLLAAACPLLLERFLAAPTFARMALFVLAGTAALLSHYELALYLAGIVAVGSVGVLRLAWQGRRHALVFWLLALVVLALIGTGVLWAYALPQRARLPAMPCRQVDSVARELATWGRGTVGVVRFLLWGAAPTRWQWFGCGLLLLGALGGVLHPGGRRLVAYLVASLAIGFVAAGCGLSAYGHRYVWYAFPLVAVLVSAGTLSPLWLHPRRRYHVLAAAGVAAILVASLVVRLPHVSGVPFPEEERLADVVRYVEEHRRQGDVVYVYYGAAPAFEVYASDELERISVIEEWGRGPRARRAQLWATAKGRPRVWFVMSHRFWAERSRPLPMLRSRCRPLDAVHSVRAAAYLFDCTAAAPARRRPAPR